MHFAERVFDLRKSDNVEDEYVVGGKYDDPDGDNLDEESPLWETVRNRFLLKGGGNFKETVTSVACAFASVCSLACGILLVQAGGRAIETNSLFNYDGNGTKHYNADYILATLGLCLGICVVLNAIVCLVGLWKYSQQDPDFDSALLQVSHRAWIWLLLVLLAHGLATSHYYSEPDESVNSLLADPSHKVTRFWFEITDFVCIVLMLMNVGALLNKDIDCGSDNINHAYSLRLCCLYLLTGGLYLLIVNLLGIRGVTGPRLGWHPYWPLYINTGNGFALVFISMWGLGAYHRFQSVLVWALVLVAASTLTFGILSSKQISSDLHETLLIAVMVSIAVPVFAAIGIASLLVVQSGKNRNRDLLHPSFYKNDEY
jgi:hypothetical protein